jgi:hypothetical protein
MGKSNTAEQQAEQRQADGQAGDQALPPETPLEKAPEKDPEKAPETPPAEKGDPTIEEHKAAKKTAVPVFAAVMAAQGWASGKRVPLTVYEKAVSDFMNGPADGRKIKEEEAREAKGVKNAT